MSLLPRKFPVARALGAPVAAIVLVLLGGVVPGGTGTPFAAEAPIVRESRLPGGELSAVWEVRLDDSGTDVRHGRLWRYHPNGRVSLQGRYRDGEPTGLWQWWDENGFLLRSIRYEYGIAMPQKGTAQDRPEVTFRQLDGRPTAEGLMKGDRPHGRWQFWYRDGSPRAVGEYRTGIPHGHWKHFYPNGQLRTEAYYEVGVLNGPFREGYENGQEKRAGNMDQGLKQGRWRYYHRDGKLQAEGNYVSDLQDGEWRYWDERGRIVRRAAYRAGRLLDVLEIPPELRDDPPVVVTEDDVVPAPRLFDEFGAPISTRP